MASQMERLEYAYRAATAEGKQAEADIYGAEMRRLQAQTKPKAKAKLTAEQAAHAERLRTAKADLAAAKRSPWKPSGVLPGISEVDFRQGILDRIVAQGPREDPGVRRKAAHAERVRTAKADLASAKSMGYPQGALDFRQRNLDRIVAQGPRESGGVGRALRTAFVEGAESPFKGAANFIAGAVGAPKIENKMQAQRAAAREASPFAYAAGNVLGEVAGTLPLILTGGGAIGAIGRKVMPYAAPLGRGLQTIGRAFSSGGATTGRTAAESAAMTRMGRAGQVALRAAGGASAGAADALLNDRDVVSGAALGGGIPLLGVVFRHGWGMAVDFLTQQAGKIQAAKILRDTVGSNADELVEVLSQAAPEELRGAMQYLLRNGIEVPPKLAALERAAFSTNPGLDVVRGVAQREQGILDDQLAAVRGTPGTLTDAVTANRNARAAAVNEAAEIKNAILSTVDEAGALTKRAEQLQGVADDLSAASRAEVQQYVRMRVGEQKSWRASVSLSGKPIAEKADRFNTAAGNVAARNQGTSTARTQFQGEADAALRHLESRGLNALDIDNLVAHLTKAERAAKNASPERAAIMGDLVDRLTARAKAHGGIIDATGLYEIRKGINDTVKRLAPNAGASAQARMTASLTADIRPIIDDAIEAAGGKGWRKYVDDLHRALEDVDQQALALKLSDLPEDTFTKIAWGEAPDALADLTKGRYWRLADAVGSRRANRLIDHANELGAHAVKKSAGLPQVPSSYDYLTGAFARNAAGRMDAGLPLAARVGARVGGASVSHGGGMAGSTIENALSNRIAGRAHSPLANAFASPQGMANAMGVYPGRQGADNVLHRFAPVLTQGARAAADEWLTGSVTDTGNYGETLDDQEQLARELQFIKNSPTEIGY